MDSKKGLESNSSRYVSAQALKAFSAALPTWPIGIGDGRLPLAAHPHEGFEMYCAGVSGYCLKAALKLAPTWDPALI